MLLRTMALLCTLSWLAGCAREAVWAHQHGAAHPLAGAILDVADGRFITADELFRSMRAADYVLLGESHDNLDHHRLQAEVVERLGSQDRGLSAVAFEMIDASQQADLVGHLSEHPADAAGLGPVLDWERRGWPAFAAYQPIFEAALGAGAEIVAGNLPRGTVGAIAQRGLTVLPHRFLGRTGLDQPLAADDEAGLRRRLISAHCGQAIGLSIEDMIRVQRARDASLAERLATLRGRGRAVLIAGAEHVRKDWGAPWYLDRIDSRATVISLAFLEVGDGGQGASGELPFDYVWHTPAVRPPGASSCPGDAAPSSVLEADLAPAPARPFDLHFP